jgi:nucleoside-diphosphate-sugar epimerase
MILVTGASGHLGANLVRRLLSDGHEVRVLVRSGSRADALDGLPIQRFHGDIRDPNSLIRPVSGCDRVYHCAAQISTSAGGEREIFDCNVLGTRNVLAAARRAGVERVVVTGSFSAIGHDAHQPSDEEVPFYPFDRHLPYAHTKALAEHECRTAVVKGLDVVIVASTAIIGPNDFAPSRLGRVLLHFVNGRVVAYMPGGFEFVSTGDIVEGHLLAMEHGQTGHKYLISTEFMTMDALMGVFADVTGVKRRPLRLPGPLMAGTAVAADLVTRKLLRQTAEVFTPAAVRLLRMGRRADCSKAKRELGFQPTSVAEAVEQAYGCFRRRGLIARTRPPQPTVTPADSGSSPVGTQ